MSETTPGGPAGTRGAEVPSGARRTSLSREAILRAALRVADRDQLGGLTMRKIASELGSSPMGIYRHFRNKAEIVGGLVDHVVGDCEVTNCEGENWIEWVRETLLQLRRALHAHPGILPLLGGAVVAGESVLRLRRRVLDALRRGKLGETEASLFHTLMCYTIGDVAIEGFARSQTSGEERRLTGRRSNHGQLDFGPAGGSTSLDALESTQPLAGFTGEDQFASGLDRILSSMSADRGDFKP